MNRACPNPAALACLLLALAAPAAGAQQAAGPSVPVLHEPDPAERMFRAMDTDRNGELSLAEFRAGWQRLQQLEGAARLRRQFAAVDLDRSGVIEAGEYARLRLIKSLGAKAPPLSRFDGDGDGALGLEEYARLVRELAQAGAAQDGSR